MAEAIMISIFLMVLLFLQVKEQKHIVIFAKVSWVKRCISIFLAVTMLLLFWQDTLQNQIKLITFAGLILSMGFLKDGLAKDHLIKLGVLTGEYQEYKWIQLEQAPNNQTFVSFYKRKNNSFSLFFSATTEELATYFETLGLSGKIVIGPMPTEVGKKGIKTPKQVAQ